MGCGASTQVRDETAALDELMGSSKQRHILPVFESEESQEIQSVQSIQSIHSIQTLPLKPKGKDFVPIVITEKDQHHIDDSGLDCQSSMKDSMVPKAPRGCQVPIAPSGRVHRRYLRQLNRFLREEENTPSMSLQVDWKREMHELQMDLSELSTEFDPVGSKSG